MIDNQNNIRNYDVNIIGAGPAGLYLSQLLAAEGLHVRVLEQKQDVLYFPFHTLGSFLEVKEYGFTEDVIAANVSEAYFHSRLIHTKKKGPSGFVFVLNKKKLHEELLDKCKHNGVIVQSNTRITGMEQNPDGSIKHILDQNGNKYSGKLFVDCSGHFGVLTKKVGLLDKKIKLAIGLEYNVKYKAPDCQAHLFYGKKFADGYGWIFPLGNGRAIAGFGSFARKDGKSLKQRFNHIVLHGPYAKLVEKDNDNLQGGSFPVTEVKTKFIHRNLIGIGDSVSQGSHLLGEGYRYVLDAAKLAAPAIINSLKNEDEQLLNQYETDWNNKFRRIFLKHKKLQELAFRCSDNDWLSDFLSFMMMTKTPKTFAKLISGDITRRELFLP